MLVPCRACRHALDALVEETLLFVAEVLRGGEGSYLCKAIPVLCTTRVQRGETYSSFHCEQPGRRM